MLSKKLTNSQQKLEDEVKAALKNMQTDPLCTFETIGFWIEEHANRISKSFAGRIGRKLSSYQTVSLYGINKYNDQLVLSLNGSWDIQGSKGLPPDTKVLSSLLSPSMRFIQQSYSTFRDTLGASLHFNLEDWPHLRHEALVYFLRDANSETTTAASLKFCEDNIKVLLDNFYPNISVAYLNTMVELGVLDLKDEEIISWLRQGNAPALTTPVVETPEFDFT